jgi:integrase/recombinase XerD
LAERPRNWTADFAEWLTAQGRAPNTVAAYRRDIAAYERWCAGPGVGVDNPLGAYVDHVRATRRPTSAARAVVALRIFHRWRDDAVGTSTPVPELVGRPLPASPAEHSGLTEEVIDRLCASTVGESVERRRDAVAVTLLYFAGLKAGEAISLDVADISADRAVITVDRAGPHERLLPVVPALHGALDRWLENKGRARLHPTTGAVLVNRRGQRLTRQGLWLLTGAVGKRAGLPQTLSPNDLRKACAAHLANRELPPGAVNAFLGHSRGQVPTLAKLNLVGWGSCNLVA